MIQLLRPLHFVVFSCSLRLFLQDVSAMEIGSEIGTMFAYGSAMDPLGIRFYISGADATPSFGSTTVDKTSCYTGVGRAAVGLERKLFAEPSMCLDMIFFPSTSASTANANGIMATMDTVSEQPQLHQIQYTNYKLSLQQPFDLPTGYFPALMAKDSNSDSIYVALHPTNGLQNRISNNGAAANNKANLPSTHDYLLSLSHPRHTSIDTSDDVGYSPILFKYNMQTGQEEWRFQFETTNGKTLLAGMATVDNDRGMVVFGSSTGNVLVDEHQALTGPGPNTTGTRWDGFMVWVDPQDGTIDLSEYYSPTHNELGGSIRSQRNADDFILGTCMDGNDAFVVGHTTGKFEGTVAGGAFVIKINTHGRDFTWKRQFVGQGLEFTHCVVRGESVVVGGTSTERQAPRNGNDAYTGPTTQDLVVVQLDKNNGETQLIRQIDSHREDFLVNMELRGGNGVGSDLVYIFANAWNWNAQPTPTNDLYVMTIDDKLDHQWLNIDPTLDPITMLKEGSLPGDKPSPAPTPAPTKTEEDQNASATGGEDEGVPALAIVLPIILVALMVPVVSLYMCRRKRSGNEANDDAGAVVKEQDNGPTLHGGEFDDVESVTSENKIV